MEGIPTKRVGARADVRAKYKISIRDIIEDKKTDKLYDTLLLLFAYFYEKLFKS